MRQGNCPAGPVDLRTPLPYPFPMCGRYTLRRTPGKIKGIDLGELPAEWRDLQRYNVAPTQKMPVVRWPGRPEATELSWGIRAKWQKESARPLINARSETAATKPTFRDAVARRRCLVPADGFFEWKRDGKPAQPFFFHLESEAPFWFAGIWEDDAYLILTTRPNALLEPIHDRMPVILDETTAGRWLGDTPLEKEAFESLCSPYPADRMGSREVGRRVNNARYDGPECVEAEEGLL